MPLSFSLNRRYIVVSYHFYLQSPNGIWWRTHFHKLICHLYPLGEMPVQLFFLLFNWLLICQFVSCDQKISHYVILPLECGVDNETGKGIGVIWRIKTLLYILWKKKWKNDMDSKFWTDKWFRTFIRYHNYRDCSRYSSVDNVSDTFTREHWLTHLPSVKNT